MFYRIKNKTQKKIPEKNKVCIETRFITNTVIFHGKLRNDNMFSMTKKVEKNKIK